MILQFYEVINTLFFRGYLLLAGDLLLSLSTLPESILESACQSLHVFHTSRAYSSATLSLGTPIVVSHLLSGVSTARACLLLDVVRSLATTTACRVRLVVPFSE